MSGMLIAERGNYVNTQLNQVLAELLCINNNYSLCILNIKINFVRVVFLPTRSPGTKLDRS